jgi:hypothetical protein
MARLWRDQGQQRQARDLLAPVYNWFTEGFHIRPDGGQSIARRASCSFSRRYSHQDQGEKLKGGGQ